MSEDRLARIEAKLDLLGQAVSKLIEALTEEESTEVDLEGNPLPADRDTHTPL